MSRTSLNGVRTLDDIQAEATASASQPLDALTLVAAAGILVLTAIVASAAPAARAVRVDPAVTLRGDA